MTTKLRDLLDDAEMQVNQYKHPDIDDFKVAMSEVLEAAGVGSLMRDCVESIREMSMNNIKYIEIGTSWSARGCSQTSEYRIPSFVIDSAEPLKEAHKWRLEKAKGEAEHELASAQASVVRHATKLAEIEAQLQTSHI